MSKLLPRDFDERVNDSIKQFWTGRLSAAVNSQEGGRGSVIGGKNLDGFADLIRHVGLFCGISSDEIVVAGKSRLTIPGYFRPTKMWDSIVLYKRRLIAIRAKVSSRAIIWK